MCRILAYLGPELPLDELLLKPSNSLINQSKAPEHHPLMQLAGWGFGAWSSRFLQPERPLVYRRPIPAFFDDNARNIIPSLTSHTALAHVRAATYASETVMADENCHPFAFKGTPWILVHNGAVPNWRVLQRELLSHCDPEFVQQMRGTTDTEFVFVLLLSLLKDNSTDAFQAAFEQMIKLILQAMANIGMVRPSKLKLALASPNTIVAVNYGSGFHGETDIQGDWKALRKAKVGSSDFRLSTVLEPLYLLCGRDFEKHEQSYNVDPCEQEPTTAILASEPLTQEKNRWVPLNFGSLMRLERRDGIVKKEVRQLQL
jgi:glutamine amidotransferase